MKIKKITLFLLTAAAAAVLAKGAYAGGGDAALEDLLVRAAASNPQIAAAEQRTEAARAQVEAATAQMGPDVFAGLGALWQRDGVTVGTFVPAIGAPLAVDVVGRNTYAAAVGLSQVIYAGGSLSAQKEASRLALGAVEAQEERVRQSAANAVRRAYYALRCAQAKEQVARDALSLSKDHMTQAEKLFNAGVVARNDVLRSEVAVSSAELDLIRARNGCDLALTALRRAVGAELPENLKKAPLLDETLDAPDKYGQAEAPEKATEVALEKRAELKSYSLLSNQAEKLARAAQGRMLPQILGAVGYVAADDSFFPGDNGEPVAAIGMYWNLYDSGEMRAKTKEAKAKAKELLFQLEDMKNLIRMEVAQAELNLESAASRLAVASKQVEKAREDYRIAVRRYAENVGTNLDVLDSRLALTNSLTELCTAAYDIKTAEADLLYATGE